MSPKFWLRLEDISAIFIVLGFIGGLTSHSIVTAVGSAILWFAIFRIVKNRNRRNGIRG
jgi:hypothetical protein